ncbi:MAG: cytochrome c biogenesis CcdA family protein [Acidimicrobiales bacterium]
MSPSGPQKVLPTTGDTRADLGELEPSPMLAARPSPSRADMEALALPLFALVAGLVSFSSPCCLPLLPGYLSYISALPVSELGDREARRATVRASMLFVAGFTTVFTIFGIGATWVGSLFLRNQDALVRVFGVVIIVMGLVTMGALQLPVLMRERRINPSRVPRGPAFAFPMGMAFAAGWAPCIGPVLATILATAAATGMMAWGAVLLIIYSVGLGIPFVLLALGFSRAQRSLAWLRRNGRRIEVAGGALLVTVGVLFVSGRWISMFRPLQRWFAQLGWPPI